MKLKLMISALVLCSSLSFAADVVTTAPTTAAPKKKAMKVLLEPSSTAAPPPTAEAGLGGLGTAGSGTAAKPKKGALLRGTGSALTR